MFELRVDEKGFFHIVEEELTIEEIIATEIELKVDENGYYHIEETLK